MSDGPAHEAKWTLGVAYERHEVCRRVAHRVAIDRYQVSDPEAVEDRSLKEARGLGYLWLNLPYMLHREHVCIEIGNPLLALLGDAKVAQGIPNIGSDRLPKEI